MTLIALITGASSGFGRMISRAIADAGHTAYASMRGTTTKNRASVADNADYAARNGVDLASIELDVQEESSIQEAVKEILARHGRIDVLVQNAGHMVYGPSEAFTPQQLSKIYDVNVLGTHRVNREVLPHMRAARRGLLVWISSSSIAGGVPPFLGPYFAAKAAMDALAVSYAKELAPLGIETSIVVPGAFTTGTNHFAHAGFPDDAVIAAAYARDYPAGFAEDMKQALAATVPDSADPGAVARAVVELVSMPHGHRPLRIVIDPADDGSVVSLAVIDRVRSEFLHRIGYARLLHPTPAFEACSR